jgi:hypothetical protein
VLTNYNTKSIISSVGIVCQHTPLRGFLIINFQEITLAEKELFDEYFSKRRYESAHHNFTNFFMWGDFFNVRWAVLGEHLCLKAGSGKEAFMLQPIGADKDIEKTLELIEKYFHSTETDFVLKGVEKFMVDIIEKWRPGCFEYTTNRNNHDYVYKSRDLAELTGRKYHAKKNHVNKFIRTYPNYQYISLTEEWRERCIENLEEWCLRKDCEEDKMLMTEKVGIIEVLTHFPKLKLKGGIILINGVVEAFTFGEAVNDDTALIHVEKANPDIHGVYAVINRDFCREAWPNMTYVNREEDLGLEGLRKAKESYHPEKMIEKFEVRVRRK